MSDMFKAHDVDIANLQEWALLGAGSWISSGFLCRNGLNISVLKRIPLMVGFWGVVVVESPLLALDAGGGVADVFSMIRTD